ncbi:MAG TPA: homoserine O-acetyltransferase [Actinomycetota bacterium]|nr:homoserine O-acetyltransferase [Actinomycetota bacterium]
MSTSGGCPEGETPARRRFVDLGAMDLELGGHLPEVRVAYETWGTFTGNNAVLVQHALTGDAHAAGPAGPGQPTAGWWDELIGPGKAIDTRRWFVLSSNVLGGCRGTTGPSSIAPDGRAYGSRWPRITIRDQVSVEVALADVLGIDHFTAVMGGSMGGMRTLEWIVAHPERVGTALVMATSASATADQIATQGVQIQAIQADPDWQGGDYHGTGRAPLTGMGIARRIAHLTYRTERELAGRFGRDHQLGEDALTDGRFAVQSYLDHQADKLNRRFDPGTYVALSDAMSLHDVYRGRGLGVLREVEVPTRVLGISSDRLYPLYLQQQIAAELGVQIDVVESPFGHDGFLLEGDEIGRVVVELLAPMATTC